ncbi:MAG: rubrerythrin family protein [Verrucomicrobia bacterium]|nr:rubrerythrin family protein [Verrucomicrobiota bacterium]
MNIRGLVSGGAFLWLAATAGAQPGSGETISNLNVAHHGEANAHHRYGVYAVTADNEGFAQVAKLFRAAAVAEATHEFTHMGAILNLGGKVESSAPETVAPGTTLANLKQVVAGEKYERDTMYPGFLKLAEAERAHAAVRSFGFAAAVEKQHARLFAEALAQAGKIPAVDYFVCPICGTTTTGAPAPGKCPTCQNPTTKYVNIR